MSRATGFFSKFINAGDVQNTGVEVSLYFRPVHTRDFDWRVDLNWARNRNKVLDLGGIQNLLLASFQGGVSINAAVGEPYGTIKGRDFQKAFLSMWFGAKPVMPTLKAALLGKST